MRTALLALLLAWLPATALAQSASTPNPFQQMGLWAQQVSAAQQPMSDGYERCKPAIAAMASYLGAPAESRGDPAPMLAHFTQCLAEIKTAAIATRTALGEIGPMPELTEHMLNIDSADLLRRSATAVDGMVDYIEQSDAAMQLIVGGDLPGAHAKLAEARLTAASVFDGQIILLEAMQASMPMQTHKRMIDIRLAISRSMRVVAGSDPAAMRGVLATLLRGYGTDARSAARGMRSAWQTDSAGIRNAAKLGGDPALTRMIVILDTAMERISAGGDEVADILEAIPSGAMAPAEILKITDRLTQGELRILAAIREMSAAATQ